MINKKNAVVLLSGGLDSSTCLALAKAQDYCIYALSFNYGQRHEFEIEAARRVAQHIGVEEHIVAQIDLRAFGGSALTSDMAVPKSETVEDIKEGIPVTYVPARNTIFLSFALAWAEVVKAEDIFIGINAVDYSGYPDCRPEYLSAYQKMANLATKAGVDGDQNLKIHAPLVDMKKSEIIQTGLDLQLDYSLTLTCYDPIGTGQHCGHCDACLLRRKGFADLGMEDPAA